MKVLSIVALFGALSLASCKKEVKTEAAATTPATTEAAAPAATPSTLNGAVAVNLRESNVGWTGTKPGGKHTGTINFKEGSMTFENGNLVNGNFLLDLTSIACTDLTGDDKAKLEGHLKGLDAKGANDFFNVNKYPVGKIEISKLTKVEGDATATHLAYGKMMLKDITKDISFKVKVETNGPTVKVTAPEFKINRTDWGINYGSKSIFKNLKDKFIDDEVAISINVMNQL